MSGNSLGNNFRITTCGESHGGGVGVVIDGCPAGLKISSGDIQEELDRRRPGQNHITTSRQELDRVEILSGIFNGKTIGTPIAMLIRNKDANSDDYKNLKEQFRPGHADFTYEKKYGIRNWAGGGRASARETIGRVAAGAIAKQFLRKKCGIEIVAAVSQVGNVVAKVGDEFSRSDVEKNIVRCPDNKKAEEMISLIESIQSEGDSIGGVIRCVARNVPIGLGEPVFDKLSADLAKAMISIPAAKAFEIGSGKNCLSMKGSEHNDIFEPDGDGGIEMSSNNAGGVLGGISNGQDIVVTVTFKPVSTLFKPQMTVNKSGEAVKLQMKGRHDPCVVPRAVPVVEAMMALVLADHELRNRGAQL